jgi:hypothetical protein
MKLEIDWLKANHTMIHYFGLGFIQLKLDQFKRFHFYTSELPQIVGEEEIHNHRYDFQSTILLGKLTQEIYGKIDGDTHVIEDESCQEGVTTGILPSFCGIELLSMHNYGVGSYYFVDHNTFHRVKADNCVTILNRTDYKKQYAKVIRPVGTKKVCPFSQKVDEKRLWEIIEGIIV